MVGIINTAAGLTAMLLLFHLLGFSYWFSTFLGNTAGAAISFVLNRHFTFQSNAKTGTSAIRFIAVILFCYGVSYSVSPMAAEAWERTGIAGPPQDDAAILIGMVLYTLMNYFLQKNFVFRMEKTPSVSAAFYTVENTTDPQKNPEEFSERYFIGNAKQSDGSGRD